MRQQLAPSAYLAAFWATSELQTRILNAPNVSMDQYENAVLTSWSGMTSATAPSNPSAFKQHNWDKPVVGGERDRLLAVPEIFSKLQR